MIPPKEEKRYHPKTSFFSFFGNLPPNNSGELTKKGNPIQNTGGIKNTLEVTSLYSLVKKLLFFFSRTNTPAKSWDTKKYQNR